MGNLEERVLKFAGRRLARFRRMKGLSQIVLAEKAGVSTALVWSAERGTNIGLIFKLIWLMDCDPTEAMPFAEAELDVRLTLGDIVQAACRDQKIVAAARFEGIKWRHLERAFSRTQVSMRTTRKNHQEGDAHFHWQVVHILDLADHAALLRTEAEMADREETQ